MAATGWNPGESAMYVGELVTVSSTNGLFCDVQTEAGRTLRNVMQSNLSVVPKTPTPVHRDDPQLAATVEQLSGVEEAMARPVAPNWYADPGGTDEAKETAPQEAVIVLDEVAKEKEAMAEPETGKKRKYRPEGYRCDLCPDLPPFETGMLKAGHVKRAHPKPKAEAMEPVEDSGETASRPTTDLVFHEEALNEISFLVGQGERLAEQVERLLKRVDDQGALVDAFALVLEYFITTERTK